jgi:hypothetical protein
VLAYGQSMALVIPTTTPRTVTGLLLTAARVREAATRMPLAEVPTAPAGEGTLRERVRMELLVARARSERS